METEMISGDIYSKKKKADEPPLFPMKLQFALQA